MRDPLRWGVLALYAMAMLIAVGGLIGTALIAARLDNVSAWIRVVERRVDTPTDPWPAVAEHLEPQLASMRAELDECYGRLDDVRVVLETLIKTDRWPGRDRLPEPIASWPPWPARGAHIGSTTEPGQRNVHEVTPEEAVRIRQTLSPP